MINLIEFRIPVSDRVSFLYAEKGYLELDGHAVVLRQEDRSVHFPVGAATAILLMPGSVVTHAAVRACAEEDCILLWVGEGGVRCYSAGNPGRNAEALLRQAELHLNANSRLQIARKIYRWMFDEVPPSNKSIEQLRGMEGARVRALYQWIADQCDVPWHGRDQKNALADPLNRAISGANAALYGLCEAVIVTLGYAPSIGFVHSGDSRSFVFDVADCLKFRTVVPLAMKVHRETPSDTEGAVRRACRDMFRAERMAEQIVSLVEDLLG